MAAAAAAQALMKQVVVAVVCPGDRLTAWTAWRVCGTMRKTNIVSKYQQNTFEILTFVSGTDLRFSLNKTGLLICLYFQMWISVSSSRLTDESSQHCYELFC